jgi:Helix-turn-helix domain
MDDFQKQMSRLRRNSAFAGAFDKKRAEAEVAFQIRRLREAKGWTQKDLARKAGCSHRRSPQSSKLATSVTRCRFCAASPESWMQM